MSHESNVIRNNHFTKPCAYVHTYIGYTTVEVAWTGCVVVGCGVVLSWCLSPLYSLRVQMSYEIDRICACEYLEEKGGRCVVRIVRTSKDGGFKEMDFEVEDVRRASGFIGGAMQHLCVGVNVCSQVIPSHCMYLSAIEEIVQKMESILKTRPTRGRRKYLERASK